jgi:NAD(P)-dependent dehydrogenase (short-subunit alcohol dehydrogenase family)
MTSPVALITGGTSGIGLATAHKFAEQGFDLVLLARHAEGLRTAEQQLARYGRQVTGLVADLSTPAHLPAIVAAVHAACPRLDVLVNNAGLAKFAPVADYNAQDYEALFDFNVRVPFQLIQALLSQLVASQGAIVVISTYWAQKMQRGRPSSLYSASRGAMVAMVKALASELGDQGVRINAVAPGSTETETLVQWRASLPAEKQVEFSQEIARNYPLPRLGTPAEIAEAVFFLASKQARWITGQVLQVDGGFTIR